MSIYPSSKVLPYVYQCVHKITGKIYIGSRTNKKQKLPSHLDFPKYRTSSKYVKPIFDEFNWIIVAEFFNGQDAYNFEQQLIHEQWLVSKEMSLNHICYHEKKSWNTIGIPRSHDTILKLRKPKSEEHKQKLRKPKTEQAKRNMSKIIDVLTPDGFVIENITIKELCSQFGLIYNSTIRAAFRNGIPFKGFSIL